MRGDISERQRIQAARWVMERRKQRGKSVEEIRPALRRLLKKIKDLIRGKKEQQQWLKKIASTPGFRHRASKEVANAAWQARLATSSMPVKPPRPKAPRKGKQPRKILESGWKLDWNWALLPGMEDLERAEVEADFYAGYTCIPPEEQSGSAPEPADMVRFEELINEAVNCPGNETLSPPSRSLAIVKRLSGLQMRLKWIQKEIPAKPEGGMIHQLLNHTRPKMADLLYGLIQNERIYDPIQITERLIHKLGVSCREEVADQFIIETALSREKEPYLAFDNWIKQISKHWNWSELKKELLRAVGFELFIVPEDDEGPAADDQAQDISGNRVSDEKLRDMLRAFEKENEKREWVERFGYITEQEKPIAEAIKAWHELRKPPPKYPRVEIVIGRDGRVV